MSKSKHYPWYTSAFLILPVVILAGMLTVGVFAGIAEYVSLPQIDWVVFYAEHTLLAYLLMAAAFVGAPLAIAYRCEIATWLCGKREQCPLKGVFDCVA